IKSCRGFEQDSRRCKGAALGQQPQHPALDRQPLAAARTRRKPGDALARQPHRPSLFTTLDAQVGGRERNPCLTQRLAGALGGDRFFRHRQPARAASTLHSPPPATEKYKKTKQNSTASSPSFSIG